MTVSESGAELAYRVHHRTEYVYSEPVSASLHHAVLVMRATDTQEVFGSQVTVDPLPQWLVTRVDYYGNHLTRFSVETKSQRLQVDARSEVKIRPRPVAQMVVRPSVAELRELMSTGRGTAHLRALEFAYESHHVPRTPALASYAAEFFEPEVAVFDAAANLMHRIHKDFTYDPAVTDISTPVLQILERKHGVCQDFAHLMIGCLRSLGVPARYVSGYLVPLPGVVGAQASHAWVSAYCPGVGWVDFDPTNDVLPSTGHITVAWGRDFADVSPLRGVILGGGSHTVHVQVRVEAVAHS